MLLKKEKNVKKLKQTILTALLAGAFFVSSPNISHADKIIVNHDLTPGVNVRSENYDSAPILGGIDYQDYYQIKGEDKYWYEISYEGKTAYVGKKWFFKFKDHKLTKDSPLKEKKSQKSKTIEKLKKDEKVTVLEVYSDDFAKVFYKDKIGYINFRDLDLYKVKYQDQEKILKSIKDKNKVLKKYEDFGSRKDYAHEDGNFIKERPEEEAEEFIDEEIYYEYYEVSGDGSDIYWYGSQFLGNPYVFGGNDLVNGIDCSGFTREIYKEFGVDLPRIAKDQYPLGESIPLGEENAGDLVFYGNSPETIYHVAIADGNGGIIHASSPKTGIITSYIGKPLAIKRIIE